MVMIDDIASTDPPSASRPLWVVLKEQGLLTVPLKGAPRRWHTGLAGRMSTVKLSWCRPSQKYNSDSELAEQCDEMFGDL